ncbi:hypothetical protein MMC10_010059 [Thelotrema lepadinum]|nr:hypothetical protein [Thelotrema lepadinum]
MTTVEASSFTYQPLDDRLSTRILILEPSPVWEDALSCRLRHIGLQPLASESWEALSYTWGNVQPTTSILLNEFPFDVSPNLSSFLRHRRDSQNPVKLWIDAICINQSNAEEKASQVKIMGPIYLAAPNLVIWLGPSADNSDLAMQKLSKLGGESPFDKMPMLTSEEFQALNALFNRPWWYRSWIVQEVFWGGCGSKINNIRVRCGQPKVFWTNLVVAAARMQAHAKDLLQLFPTIDKILRLEKLRYHVQELNDTERASKDLLLHLIALHRQFQATDPRDKIFAFNELILSYRNRIAKVEVSYSTSITEIYAFFAAFSIMDTSSLQILRHCNERSMKDLPSWVPDWSVCGSEEPLLADSVLDRSKKPWYFKSSSRRLPSTEEDFNVRHGPSQSFKLLRDTPDIKDFQLHDAPPVGALRRTLPSYLKRNVSQDIADGLQNAMDQGILCIFSDEADEKFTGSKSLAEVEADLISEREAITQRDMDRYFAALLSGSLIQYRAAGTSSSRIDLSAFPNALSVHGIILDEIQMTQPPFLTNVQTQWEATQLLVAIAHCKSAFLTSYTGKNPYQTYQAREVAFWLSLFAGHTKSSFGQDLGAKISRLAPFWLRRLPAWYEFSKAPLTATSTGRLDFAEEGQAIKRGVAAQLKIDSETIEISYPGISMREDLQPEEWTGADREVHRTRFDALALLWQQTPFDLYARPFDLPVVIPDPFYSSRQKDPELLAKAKNRKLDHLLHVLRLDEMATNLESEHRYQQQEPWDDIKSIERELQKVVPLVPMQEDVLEAGFERYALGRKMFGTTLGYLGIGPKGLCAGDVVAIIAGLEVPLILRERHNDDGYEVIGEAYVHGVMNGEGFDETKASQIKLV